METVNRTALIVRPKRRFVEWVNRVDDREPKLTLEEVRTRPTIYLVEGLDSVEDDTELIDMYVEEIFEEQLAGWLVDEAVWPGNRTPHLFRDWFDVEVVETVLDTEDTPLTDDDLLDDLRLETLAHCAWCDLELAEDANSIAVGMKHPTPDELAGYEGQAIPIPLASREHPVFGLVPTADSNAWKEGQHVVFTLCSETCALALKRAFEQERAARLS